MKIDRNEISDGVRNAFDFWLSEHPISFRDLAKDAIAKSFSDWLMEHDEDIVTRVVDIVAANAFVDGETILKLKQMDRDASKSTDVRAGVSDAFRAFLDANKDVIIDKVTDIIHYTGTSVE